MRISFSSLSFSNFIVLKAFVAFIKLSKTFRTNETLSDPKYPRKPKASKEFFNLILFQIKGKNYFLLDCSYIVYIVDF